MSSDLQQELKTAIELARKAGARIMEHYRGDFEVQYKDADGTDPVTAADQDANDIIVQGLAATFPNDAVLAEESKDSQSRLANRRLWVVDPLDGTRDFVERTGQFVVMIGLAIDGKAVLGVVLQPTEDTLWWGAPHGAGEIRSDGTEVDIKPSTVSAAADATMMVSRSHRSATVTAVAERMGVEREMPFGSVGLKVARVAAGHAEMYISITDRTKEWDACAPEAILAAAGGSMTDIAGRPLVYNKEQPQTTYGMLASNGLLHAAAVEALGPVVADKGW